MSPLAAVNSASELTPTRSAVDERRLVSLRDLKRGMIIRHKGDAEAYVVCSNYGTRVTAVKSVDVTNCDEWEIVG